MNEKYHGSLTVSETAVYPHVMCYFESERGMHGAAAGEGMASTAQAPVYTPPLGAQQVSTPFQA